MLAAEALPCWSAIIDGEVIVIDARGISDFRALRAATGKEPARLTFVAFGLLHLDGHELRAKPLIERKAAQGRAAGTDRRRERADGAGGQRLKARRQPLPSGPTNDWLKVKSFTEADFEILGVVRNRGEAPFALLANPGIGNMSPAPSCNSTARPASASGAAAKR